MSKAEELLNSLAEAYKAESNGNSEPHIVIGVDRFITVPDELKRIAVQYDHNIRTVTFDCPRYYDGRDMSKMQVYINTMLPDGKPTSHYVGGSNLSVDNSDPNVMHFHWTITSDLTRVKGNLMFLVCIRKADEEGNEINHWNSELNKDLYVSEGLEFSSQMIEDKYPDIVTQLLQRMDAVEALANPEAMQGYANTWLDENSDAILANIQNKGNEVLNSIPEEYTETHNYANEGARTKADAITRIVDGDVISVNDSSDDYVRGLRVFGKTTQFTTTGKNLLQLKSKLWNVDNRGTLHVEFNTDGSVHVTGMNVQSGTIYAHSTVTASYVMLSANVEYIFNGPGDNIEWELVDNNNTTLCASQGEAVRYTSPTDIKARLRITVYADIDYDAVFYPMVRLASIEDDTWEPYTGGMPSPNPDYPQEIVSVENPTVRIYGKNLVPPRDSASTYAGITYVTNVDGSVSITGTATPDGDSTYHIIAKETPLTLSKGTYTFSGCNGGSEKSYRMLIYTVDWKLVTECSSGPVTFTLDETTDVFMYVWIYRGTTVNKTLHPMICRESFGDSTYEPHIKPQTLNLIGTFHAVPVTSGGNYTDENGQQWICDEVDFERGVYVQRTGKVVLDGTADWVLYNYQTMHYGFNVWNLLDEKHTRSPGLCNQFVNVGAKGSETIWVGVDNPNVYVISKEWYDKGLDAWKAHLNETPLEIIYARVAPIETPLTPEELDAFRHMRSNYPNTTVINDSNVKMELRYNADTEIYVDNKINDHTLTVHLTSDSMAGDAIFTDRSSSEIYDAWVNHRPIQCRLNIDGLEFAGTVCGIGNSACFVSAILYLDGAVKHGFLKIEDNTVTLEHLE